MVKKTKPQRTRRKAQGSQEIAQKKTAIKKFKLSGISISEIALGFNLSEEEVMKILSKV